MPQPFWAVIIAAMGTGLAIVVFIHPGDVSSKQAGFNLANSLVSGALGAFVGHQIGSKTPPE